MRPLPEDAAGAHPPAERTLPPAERTLPPAEPTQPAGPSRRRAPRARPSAALPAAAAAAAGYALLARPWLAAQTEYLRLLDYGASALLAALLLAAWLGRGARVAPALAATSPARRHERTVRALPDPRHAALEQALAAWLERGEGGERYAGALLAAAGREAPHVPALVGEALREGQAPGSRRGARQRAARRARAAHHGRILASLGIPTQEPPRSGIP